MDDTILRERLRDLEARVATLERALATHSAVAAWLLAHGHGAALDEALAAPARGEDDERAWLRRMVALEDEHGPLPPGGASGGVIARARRGTTGGSSHE